MVQIRISPEQVRDVASAIKQDRENCQEIFSHIQSIINDLMVEWEGQSEDRFRGEFEHWQSQTTPFLEMLESLASQLEDIATRFENADV